MRRIVVTPPSVEPITLEEAKLHLRVDHDLEDAKIDSLIRAARESAEDQTSRTLLATTFDLFLDGWPEADVHGGRRLSLIRLNDPPLVAVDSISYRDGAGVVQVLDDSAYDVDLGTPGRIYPAYGRCWPCARPGPSSVVVRYTAGWATPEDVPASVKAWMLLLIGANYENRESVVPGVSVTELPGLEGLLYPAMWGGY